MDLEKELLLQPRYPWRPRLVSFRLLPMITVLAGWWLPVQPQNQPQNQPQTTFTAPAPMPNGGQVPLAFEPNLGQADAAVHFMTHASGNTVGFTSSGMILVADKAGQISGQPAVYIHFLNATPEPQLLGSHPLPGVVNYIRGADASQWQVAVPTYAQLTYAELYPGVSLTYDGTGGQLKGTYTVAAWADPTHIHWRYEGVDGVQIDAGGNLQISFSPADSQGHLPVLTEHAPIAWQEIAGQRFPVRIGYQLAADHSVSFALGQYNRDYPLILDPTITYSTFLGGNDTEWAEAVAMDVAGNVYLTGWTSSVDFPTANALQPVHEGNRDAFVTKLNPDGTQLLYSTYLGGSAMDSGVAIVVDQAGNAYVTGQTWSTDFPTVNAAQPTFGGGDTDAFVTKLNLTGTALLYSTYIGGSGNDASFGGRIAVSSLGNAYITGVTYSPDFPTANAYQPALHGTQDAFVTELNNTGAAWVFSTYLGGSANESGDGLAIGPAGTTYLTGHTTSTDFPVSARAFDTSFNGGFFTGDVFVVRFNATGSALLYSTYLGGAADDGAFGQGSIVVDGTGNAYLTGQTSSSDFPVWHPYQGVLGGTADVFVTKLNPAGSKLVYSTYLGGSDYDTGYSIAVDADGAAYIAGHTNSRNFPLAHPLQSTCHGRAFCDDAFLAKVSPTGSRLGFSTYIGGRDYEVATGLTVDQAGNTVVITGYTASSDFPTTPGAFDSSYNGDFYTADAFVMKLRYERND